MSKQANTTLVGVFVVVGILLAVGTFVTVSSLKLFSKEQTLVMYFDESVNNLNVGASVKFKGVPLGKVKAIRIRWNQAENSDSIPVFVTIDTSSLVRRLGFAEEIWDADRLQAAVQRGLRGRLQMESFVTGLLFIELNFFESAGRPIFRQIEPIYGEIPTIPSDLALLGQSATDIMTKLASLNVKEISDNLIALIKTIRTEVEAARLPALSSSLKETSDAFRQVATSEDVKLTFKKLAETLDRMQALSNSLEGHAGNLTEEAMRTMGDLRLVLDDLRKASQELQVALSPESSTRYALDNALNELSRTAEAARDLINVLESNPNALITGRAENEKKD